MIDPQQLVIHSIVGVFHVRHEKGENFKMEKRGSWGLSFCQSGEAVYIHKGREIVSRPGSAVILPKDESYSIVFPQTGIFPLVNFTCTGIPEAGFQVIPLADEESCLRLFDTLERFWFSAEPSDRLRAISSVYSIFAELFVPAAPHRREAILSSCMRYLNDHYCDRYLSNDEIAAFASISEVYLRRLFKESFGVTPRQYILKMRIQRARRLLESSVSGVASIARTCGFSSASHFCNTFRRIEGITPAEYAEKNHMKDL